MRQLGCCWVPCHGATLARLPPAVPPDLRGRPIVLLLTPGHHADIGAAPDLVARAGPCRREVADGAYDAASGREQTRWVCPTCACSICSGPKTGDVDAPHSPVVTVRTGMLDDPSWVRPTVRFWIRSALPWVALLSGDTRLETQPSDPSWHSPRSRRPEPPRLPRFRPEVPRGESGWGAMGELDLAKVPAVILTVAKEQGVGQFGWPAG